MHNDKMLIFSCDSILHSLTNERSWMERDVAVELIETVISAVWQAAKSNNVNFIHQNDLEYIGVCPEEIISEYAIDLSDIEEMSNPPGSNIHFFINAMLDIYNDLPHINHHFEQVIGHCYNPVRILWRGEDVFIYCS